MGKVERVTRGLYRLPGAGLSAQHSLATISALYPNAVICLLSALALQDIGTQSPHEIWIAIDRKARRPRPPATKLRVVRFSGEALTSGVQTKQIEGVIVRFYSPAKSVADCFKYRNKIGLDVALEALRDCLRRKKCTRDDLWRYARICRVWNVMRPYVEALG